AQAACYALTLILEGTTVSQRDEVRLAERLAQLALFRDLVGPFGIHREPPPAQAHPGPRALLATPAGRPPAAPTPAAPADAPEEAGYEDKRVLEHLREPGLHFRGCWAIELLTGRAARELPGESRAVRHRERRFAPW